MATNVMFGNTVRVVKNANGDVVGLSAGGESFAAERERLSNIGTRVLHNRTAAFDNTTQKTFRAIIEVAPGFDAVRPLFVNGGSATYTVAGCNVRALANLTDALPTPTAVTVPASGVIPARVAVQRNKFVLGDWVDLPSVDRDDGGAGHLVCIDAYVSTSASITIMGNGTDTLDTWATRGNRKYIMRHNDGDCVTTPASFVSTTNQKQSVIAGVQYISRGRVITVMGPGDSITNGQGTIKGEGFGVPACETATASGDAYYEWANLGFPGVKAVVYRHYLDDAITAGLIPSIAISALGSPNTLDAPITAANIAECKASVGHFLRTCALNKIKPILWTILPSEEAWDSTDADRIALNNLYLNQAKAHTVIDWATAISGPADGDGQLTWGTGYRQDSVHPNDAANALMAGYLVPHILT
jgi:hypothetical protein